MGGFDDEAIGPALEDREVVSGQRAQGNLAIDRSVCGENGHALDDIAGTKRARVDAKAAIAARGQPDTIVARFTGNLQWHCRRPRFGETRAAIVEDLNVAGYRRRHPHGQHVTLQIAGGVDNERDDEGQGEQISEQQPGEDDQSNAQARRPQSRRLISLLCRTPRDSPAPPEGGLCEPPASPRAETVSSALLPSEY